MFQVVGLHQGGCWRAAQGVPGVLSQGGEETPAVGPLSQLREEARVCPNYLSLITYGTKAVLEPNDHAKGRNCCI